MLPEVVWDMPPEGTFNLHASLLPHYRGAAPVNWAIIRGEKQTGVTTFFLTHEIDAGKIILQRALPVADTDDAGVLHDALMTAGARLVTETVDLILSGRTVETIPQETLCLNPAALQPAPKIFKDTCRIDWNQPVKKVYDFIRGLSPYPAAWTELVTPDGKRQMLKIFHTSPTSPQPLPEGEGLPPSPCGEGTGVRLISDGKSYIDIALPDGCLRILSLQLTGKKRMSAPDFLAGFRQAITSCTVN
jgi:methionyl-tRNA formyltransferase